MTTGDYEAWVDGLRRWRDDPAVDLSALPPLSADSFTPATYQRLQTHLTQALEGMMATWSEALARALASARTDHDLQRELVQLRRMLARRLELARHPSFPREIRDALLRGAETDIRRIQSDLERGVTMSSARGTVDRQQQDRLLRILRSAPLTAVLEPGSEGAPRAAQPAVPVVTSARRVVLTASTEETNAQPR